MNVNINFNFPVIILSSVPQKLKNHLPIALSKQRNVWESSWTKVSSLCVILHSVREEDAETIQPTGHHGLIQQSFISPLYWRQETNALPLGYSLLWGRAREENGGKRGWSLLGRGASEVGWWTGFTLWVDFWLWQYWVWKWDVYQMWFWGRDGRSEGAGGGPGWTLIWLLNGGFDMLCLSGESSGTRLLFTSSLHIPIMLAPYGDGWKVWQQLESDTCTASDT